MILDSLKTIATHAPGRAVQTVGLMPDAMIPGLGEFKDSTFNRVLPWAVGGLVAFVAYHVWKDTRG